MNTITHTARLLAEPAKRKGYLVVEIPADEYEKLNAFWNSGTFEKATAAREGTFEACRKSAEIALDQALHQCGSGAMVLARVLASLYNGNRVKLDVSDLRRLDTANFEHALNCMRLSFETNSEPHTWFEGGKAIFEKMIKDWGFEKKGARK